MPVELILGIVLVAVLVNVVLMTALAAPPLLRALRGARARALEERAARREERLDVPGAVPDDTGEDAGGDRSRRPYDRLVRIAAWVLILVTTTLIGLVDLWPGSRPAIVLLLAVTGFAILLIHDVLPPRLLGSVSFLIEGSGAIVVISALVALTGGAASPFFFVYPLVVVGAALVVSTRTTLALALLACVGYAVVSLSGTIGTNQPPSDEVLARIGLDVVALILLAYVAAFVAREQRRSRDAAIRLSTVDSLTGLYTRAYFFTALDREVARSGRSGRGFCLLMMDLDGLKETNDRFGHFIGDRVLKGVGEVIRRGVRKTDTPARYGGDEFVVLLPETESPGAFILAEKIRQEVADRSFDELARGASTPLRASVSVGVVAYPDDGTTADELMISADRAMYASKRGGKNRVIDYSAARGGGRGRGGPGEGGGDAGGDGGGGSGGGAGRNGGRTGR